MTRFRIICPDCGAIVITETRLSALFECCPKCNVHIWDVYDALLADHCSPETGELVRLHLTA